MPGTIQVNVAGHACTTATVAAGGAGTIDVTVVGQTSPSATIVAGGVAVVTVPAGARGPEGPAGPQGPAGPPGTTTWAGITGKPSTFPPSSHAASHGQGGSDAITVAASQISGGSLPQNAVLDFNDGTSASEIGGWGFGVETGGGSEYATVTATGIVIHGPTSSTTINPAGITFADGSQQTIAWTGAYSHTHDDRYYTESEVDTLLAGKATPGDVTAAVAAVVNAAPAALDTLNELAAALGNDASFATTVTNALAAKAPLASPTFTGTVGGITATMVGLGNVPNVDATSRANHTGTQTASTISDFASAAVSAVTWTTLTGKPTFATVATTGAYSDLTGTPAAYTLPTASGSVLGGVKIGSGISIDGDGVISASAGYTLPAATTTTLGGVIVGTGLAVSSGTVSVSYGTSSGTACQGDDSRLSDARSPTAHKTSHATGGSDALTASDIGAASSTHTHAASDIASGTVATARLGSGTASSSTWLRGDSSWQTLAASATSDTTNASNISSGTLAAGRLTFSTAAQAQDGTSTTAIQSPARGRDQLVGWQHFYLYGSTVTGTGSAAFSPVWPGTYMAFTTGATASSTVVYTPGTPANAYTLSGTYTNNAAVAKAWGIAQSLYVRVWRQTGGTNAVLRVQWGEKATATAFAQLNGRGIGFEVRNQALWILAHNGTTLTQFNTSITTPGNSSTPFDVILRSDGSGNVDITYTTNGSTSTATTTGGPTSTGSGTSLLTAELTNGADAASYVYHMSQPRITNQ